MPSRIEFFIYFLQTSHIRFEQLHPAVGSNRYLLRRSRQQYCFARTQRQFILTVVGYLTRTLRTDENHKRIELRIVASDFFCHIVNRSRKIRTCYYFYRLGYLPKHNQKQQNTARLHYLLKDDLMKMDELTKQVTLLGKHQIGTDEQLFSYKRSVEDEIKTLTADRTHLRNEIRKVDISDERLSAAKAKISAISERLKELRKEVKLCDGIAKRSGVIADTLSQVKAEEEKSQRKESRNYEQRR